MIKGSNEQQGIAFTGSITSGNDKQNNDVFYREFGRMEVWSSTVAASKELLSEGDLLLLRGSF
jgi:hypothetical protein